MERNDLKLTLPGHNAYKCFFIFLSWAFISIPCIGQNLFLSTLGDPDYGEEMESIIQTNDGNLLITGNYDTDIDLDALIVKIDMWGNVIWAKTYGGNLPDMIMDIKETGNNGFIAVGYTKSFGAVSYDFWVISIDSTGNIQWEKRYGGSGDEQAWSVDIDGNNYFVVGGTNSFGAGLTDLWAIKLDLNGNIVWQNTYGTIGDDAPPGDYDEYVARGLVDQDGRYVISSISDTVGHGSGDIWLARLDESDGSILWQYAYGDSDEESSYSFAESENGGYFLSGNTIFPNGPYDGDLWGLYVDTSGNIIWQKTFGMPGIWDESLNTIATTDGGVIFCSYFEQSGSDWYASLIKADAAGNLSFANQYKINHLDWTNTATPLNDGTIAFVGVTTDTVTWNEDIMVARTDSSGVVNTNCPYSSSLTLHVTTTTTSRQAISMSVNATSVIPHTTSSTVMTIALPVHTLCSQVLSVSEQNYENGTRVFIYPNPASGNITIDIGKNINENYLLKIYNATGQLVGSQKIDKKIVTFKTGGLAKGIYFYQIQAGDDMKIIRQGKVLIQ